MRHLVVFVFPALSGEEAGLAHVEVEALQASVAEALRKQKKLLAFDPVSSDTKKSVFLGLGLD